jgi:hypothetical protein
MDNRRVFSSRIPSSYSEFLVKKKESIQDYKITKLDSITRKKNVIQFYDQKDSLPPVIAMDGTNSFVFPNFPLCKAASSRSRSYANVGIFYPYGTYLTQFGAFTTQNLGQNE